MKRPALLGILGFAFVTIASSAAASTIDTSGAYSTKIGDFGADFTPVYGQTFTVGRDNALNSFTFYLGGGAANVRAYVYAWSGRRAIGNAYYASDARTFGGTTGTAFDSLRFDVGAVNLVAGRRYVAFLTTQDLAQPSNTGASWMPGAGRFGSDAYAGGEFVYANPLGGASALFARDWDASAGALGDVQFQASFSQGTASGVPEPAAWAMLIGGFGLAGGALRRRQSQGSARFA